MNFTLDQLLALESIARTGSFAKAAQDMHRVPSAISYLIAELESSMGISIFDRSRRKAELTPAGHKILHEARILLGQARALERTTTELKGGWEPHLHVIVDGALPMGPISQCLRRFAEPSISTSLRIDVEYQEGVVHLFEEGPADLALVLGFAGDGDDKNYDCTPLGKLELLLVAAPNHPLAHETLNETNRATHAELVVRDSSPRFSKQPKPSFMGSRNVVFLSDFHSKRVALLDAAGYGWIPQHFIKADLEKGSLLQLNAEPNCWTYYPQLISQKGARLGEGAKLFMKTLLADSSKMAS